MGPTKVPIRWRELLFDTDGIVENINFDKNSGDNKKEHAKFPSIQCHRVNVILSTGICIIA